MFNKNFFLFFVFLLTVLSSNAQDCQYSIKGYVFDEGSELPLSYVNVYVQENGKVGYTDDNGNFQIEGNCPGHLHLTFSHIGCEAVKMHLDLVSDTTINIRLSHTPTSLGAVVVKGKKVDPFTQPSVSLSRQNIEDNSNQNLSALLENETGVHLIKNGSGISKPVIHGIYGNRLTILNNGIPQSGQQWGNDHSPEIDPFSADKIIILKGASALEYAAGSLGGVILTEPKRIQREPHLHGQVNYVYETNGRGNSLNARMGKYSPILAWRINGTLKKYGDKNTSNYYLNNTGIEEANFNIQLEKTWNDKLLVDLYASTFNTTLGILRGSHIENLTDLEQALISDVPLYTEPDFSYAIDAPKQKVSHQFLKARAKYFLEHEQLLEFTLAGQLNNRKEFDIRRSGRTDIPALSLSQLTLNTEAKYEKNFKEYWKFKIGNQIVLTDNTNNPETGILPLIPDYRSLKSGIFSTLAYNKDKVDFNLGLRYDYEYQYVLTISNSIPREIIRYENNYQNLGGLIALKYNFSAKQSINAQTGYAMRNPGINELYSNGLHQGVSGIEEGDINLNIEKAFKTTLEYNWLSSADFSLSALVYYNKIQDYIFLNPQDEIRLTIRGAFPVYKYEQTDANIYGLDISTQFTIGHTLFGKLKYSYLKGQDIKNNMPLIFMPPNSFFGSLTYRANQTISISDDIKLQDIEISINNRLVLEQKNILPEQDFLPPPSSYNLIGLKLSANTLFAKYKLRTFIKADNLLNTQYRDYLNRQRYFADDLGFSLTLGINYKF